jgi:hypothetical protein
MNPYVIPGLEEKRSYIEQCNALNHKMQPATPEEVLRQVYHVACNYFNVNPDTPLSSRKKKIIIVRHWTIFIAKCKGCSNSQSASFFNMNTSMAQYIIKKIMAEIDIYEKARDTFDFFIISLGLMMDYKNLKSNNLQHWLRDYYTKMSRQLKLLTQQPPEFDEDQHKSNMRNLLDTIHEDRINYYNHYIAIVGKMYDNSEKP